MKKLDLIIEIRVLRSMRLDCNVALQTTDGYDRFKVDHLKEILKAEHRVKKINDAFPAAHPEHQIAFCRHDTPCQVRVSGEDLFMHSIDGEKFESLACDYYQCFIYPDLEALAKKWGGYWEWEDAGSICFAN